MINELWHGQKTSEMIAIPHDWKPTPRQNCANFGSIFSIPDGFNFPEGILFIYLDSVEVIPVGFKLPSTCIFCEMMNVTELPEGFEFPESCVEYYFNGKQFLK